MDFETAKAAKRPNEYTVPIALDPDWARRLGEAARAESLAEQILDGARQILEDWPDNDVDAIAEKRSELKVLEAKHATAKAAHATLLEDADSKIIRFRLRALSANELDAVQAQYPTTSEQREEARRDKKPVPMVNFEAFQPALVHAALVDPPWTLEQINDIWHDPNWNVAELRQLYGTADALCSTIQVVDLGED